MSSPSKFNWNVYDTDKIIGHGYEHIYETYLDRNASVVLEFGSREGSAKLWKDYFYKGEIYCLDIVNFSPPKTVNFLKFNMENSSEYVNIPKGIDIVIEDGPHTSKTQLILLENIFNRLKPGGVIVFEDLHCTEEQYPEDLKQFKGDSDVTLNKVLREWKSGIFKDYRYINGSLFKGSNVEIFLERGTKIRWPNMNSPSEIIIVKKQG